MSFGTEAIDDIETFYPVQMSRDGSRVTISLADILPVWAKITEAVPGYVDAAGATRTAYRWTKQRPDAGGQFVDSEDQIKGLVTTDDPPQWPAFPTGTPDTNPVGQVVRLYPGIADTAADPAANHALEWFWVLPASAGAGPVTLRIQNLETYNPYSQWGVPARIQQWSYASRTWVDASTATVYVTDPNQNLFRTNEVVKADLVAAANHNAPGDPPFDTYSRAGLDAPAVSVAGGESSLSGPAAGSSGLTAVRYLYLDLPAYTGRPDWQNYPGSAHISFMPSTRFTRGILAGYPGNPPPSGYNGNDPYRQAAVFQWARGGITGFDQLATNGIAFGTGSVPGSTILGSPVANDNDYSYFANQGTSNISGGDGLLRFYANAPGGGGKSIEMRSTMTGGSVSFGDNSNYGIFDAVYVNTRKMWVGAPNQAWNNSNSYVFTGDFHAGLPGSTRLEVAARDSGGNFYSTLTQIGGNGTGSSVYLTANQLTLSSSGKTQLTGNTSTGLGTPDNFMMDATNSVFPPGAAWYLPGGTIRSSTPGAEAFGFIFYNGIYLGGLEWLSSMRPAPNLPPSPAYYPLQIQISFNPTWYLQNAIEPGY